jgi:hypothetical protein
MSNNSNVTVNLGGWGMVLTVVFFISKIMGYIDWSWWWVFAPLWLPTTALLVFFIFLAILSAM